MAAMRMHPDQLDVAERTVRRLVAAQFPQWADLPVRRVESTGTVNAAPMARVAGEWPGAGPAGVCRGRPPRRRPGQHSGRATPERRRVRRRDVKSEAYGAGFSCGPRHAFRSRRDHEGRKAFRDASDGMRFGA